jgi:uncharacterized protein (TIGR02246 family)
MRTNLFILLIGFASVVLGQSTDAEREIAQKINDWNHAWSVKDHKLAAKWYGESAEFTNAFGFHKIGQANIEEYLEFVFGLDFVMAGNTQQKTIKYHWISDEAVLVLTTVERAGQKGNDGEEIGLRKTTHYRLFEKQDEWWITAHLISDARSTERSKEH